ncbi:hypothetical protein MKW92_041950, partial [Papaver armeniacum]
DLELKEDHQQDLTLRDLDKKIKMSVRTFFGIGSVSQNLSVTKGKKTKAKKTRK